MDSNHRNQLKIRLNWTKNSFESNPFKSTPLAPKTHQNTVKNTFTDHWEGKKKNKFNPPPSNC